MKDMKSIKKLLYVAAPVLWCGVLYIGSNNSLGTVLAKSVTTVTQTVTAIATEIATETAVPTASVVGTSIETMVPTETMMATMIATENTMQIPTQTETITSVETSTIAVIPKEDGDETYATTTFVDVPITISTLVPTVVPTTVSTEAAVPTQVATLVDGTVTTETMVMQQTLVPTEIVTMTETVIVTDDGKNANSVIEQIVPSQDPEEPKPVEGWKPQTAEEKERASYVYKGKVKVVKDNRLVSIEPAMQGPLCMEAMKENLGKGSKIAYTYNIKYIADKTAKQPVYEIEKPIMVKMSIPEELLKEGRSFEMICVSKNLEFPQFYPQNPVFTCTSMNILQKLPKI